MNKKETFGSNFYLGKDFSRKTIWRTIKSKQTTKSSSYELLRVLYYLSSRKFESFKECYGKLTQRIQLKGGVGRYICFEGLGLRLELDKAATCLCNRNLWSCFELLLIEAKFAIAFRAFSIEVLENSNSQNKAMKAIARGFYTPYDFNTILWYHEAFFFSHLSYYPLCELAVAFLEALEFSAGK